jgi:prepilin-type N-terminal cleavage/methylation domain-containing protein
LRPPRRHSREHQAGFTLLETLVALAVSAMVIAAIARLTYAGQRTAIASERRVDAVETLRKVVAALPARSQLGGALTGSLDGHAWRVEARAFSQAPALPAGALHIAWTPVLVHVAVRGPAGDLIGLDMIRLRPAGAK